MSSVVSGNRDAAAAAQIQLATLRRQHKEVMTAKDIKHRAALMALKKAHSSVIASKNAKIKELQDELDETEALAGDVAKEYGTLESTIVQAEKCNAAKEDWLAKSAAQRLEKVKRSNVLLQQQKYDMGKVLTCMEMERAFEAILDDPSLYLDEDFMLNTMFKDISDKVDPFAEYISHMYEQRVTLTVSGANNDDLYYNDLRAALFYPSRKDIMQMEGQSTGLAVIVTSATCIRKIP
jgi:hypothetical protein